MRTRFEKNMGVVWGYGHFRLHGVITDVSSDAVTVMPVLSLDCDVKCYDEPGAVYDTDRDNVRLKDCPPPFSRLCAFSERGGCYALASKAATVRIPLSDAEKCGLRAVRRDDADHGVEIKHLGEDVYMAYGKVIQVIDGVFDMSTDVERHAFLERAKHLFSGKASPRPWGALTADGVMPNPDQGRKSPYLCTRHHFGYFSDPVKAALRKEFPEYADEI